MVEEKEKKKKKIFFDLILLSITYYETFCMQ